MTAKNIPTPTYAESEIKRRWDNLMKELRLGMIPRDSKGNAEKRITL
jgi:hypothetical protein